MLRVDFLIVGGGMVGAACALGLAKQGKKVALVEAIEPSPFYAEQNIDLRISAISHGSVKLLNQFGVWQQVLNMRACAYDTLETWEEEDKPLRFEASSLALSELGFMIENPVLQLALWQQLKVHQNVTLLCPQRLVSIAQTKEEVRAELNEGEKIRAKLLIAADGANSWVRQQSGIGITAWDYRHHCLLIHVKTKKEFAKITWQNFTPAGPMAFLPFVNNDACLVWYANAGRIAELKSLSLSQLQTEILRSFPSRLGDVEVIKCDSFALTRRHAKQYFQGNIVLVGDAAHSINPLAGQGVNLGFKDVALLLSLLEQDNALEQLPDILRQYQHKRKADNLLMQSAMDVFYKGFSKDIAPLKWARNLGLNTLQHSGIIKKQILKYAIGI